MRELTEDDLKIFSSFERFTGVMPSDYVSSDSTLVFFVDGKELGKAIGKSAKNIKKLSSYFKKRIVIVADSDDPLQLIKNYFGDVDIKNIEERNVMGERNYLMYVDEKQRGVAVGRNGERVKLIKNVLKKRFDAVVHIHASKML